MRARIEGRARPPRSGRRKTAEPEHAPGLGVPQTPEGVPESWPPTANLAGLVFKTVVSTKRRLASEMVDRGGRASLGQNNIITDSTVTESESTSKRNIVAKFALKEGFHEINYFLPLGLRRVPTGKPNAGSAFRDYAGRKLYLSSTWKRRWR
jgi:hypothetical protein